MINFFRKTRKKLADDNKPLKYMRYAVGEIVLVVIGILIALQINNWNEANKQEIIEIKFLKQLAFDLGVDIAYYNHRIETSERGIQSLDWYLEESYNIQNNAAEAKILLRKTFVDTDHLSIRKVTFQELISSGNLGIFSNDKLKQEVLEHYGKVEELGTNIKEFNTTTNQLMTTVFASNNVNIMKYMMDLHTNQNMYLDKEWEYLNDPTSDKFQSGENLIVSLRIRETQHLGYFRELKGSSKDLIKNIKIELDKRN